MIAKIGKGSNMYGAILYNQQKVDNEIYLLFRADLCTCAKHPCISILFTGLHIPCCWRVFARSNKQLSNGH